MANKRIKKKWILLFGFLLYIFSFGVIKVSQAGPHSGNEDIVSQWVIFHGSSGRDEDIVADRRYILYNGRIDRGVIYGEREYGINLRWLRLTTNPNPDPYVVRFSARGVANGQVIQPTLGNLDGAWSYFGYTVAIFVDSVDGGGYLCYGTREYGINLVWSHTPCYEWELQQGGYSLNYDPDRSQLGVGYWTALYNKRVHKFVVYGNRDYGINLVWRRWP